jgi:hypothetical protein
MKNEEFGGGRHGFLCTVKMQDESAFEIRVHMIESLFVCLNERIWSLNRLAPVKKK